ncbi:MAG: hypothetical protein ACP5KN_06400 [Armatimonadota bacterium]
MRQMLAVAALAAALCVGVAAQEGDALLLLDFEEGPEGFFSIDPGTSVSATADPELAHSGSGALQVQYMQRAMTVGGGGSGFPGAVVLPLMEPFEELGTVSFAIASELSTPVVVVLTEGPDGPRYNCMLWCAAGAWHEYSLSLHEFTFDLDGPPDPNETLDPGEVSVVAIFDADAFLRVIGQSTELFHVEPPEEQTLRLDDFRLLGEEPEVTPEADGAVTIATYQRPLRGFTCVGGQDVVAEAEELEGGGSALRLDYTIPERTLFAVMHPARRGSLAGMEAIRFQGRTNREVTLIISLEEKRGPGDENKSSYNATVPLMPGEGWETISAHISSFSLGDDQTDPNGALDMDLVHTVTIGDATAVLEGAEVLNSLWLRDLVAVR